MPEEIIYPASRLRAFVILIGCAVFVLLGLYTAIDRPLIGLLGVLIFGAGLPVGILMLRPGKVYLKLDAQGFEVATPFSKRRTSWKDVEAFRLEAVRNNRVVRVVYRSGFVRQPASGSGASALTATEGVVPDSYAVSPDELLRALNDWHARYGPQPEPPSVKA